MELNTLLIFVVFGHEFHESLGLFHEFDGNEGTQGRRRFGESCDGRHVGGTGTKDELRNQKKIGSVLIKACQ